MPQLPHPLDMFSAVSQVCPGGLGPRCPQQEPVLGCTWHGLPSLCFPSLCCLGSPPTWITYTKFSPPGSASREPKLSTNHPFFFFSSSLSVHVIGWDRSHSQAPWVGSLLHHLIKVPCLSDTSDWIKNGPITQTRVREIKCKPSFHGGY